MYIFFMVYSIFLRGKRNIFLCRQTFLLLGFALGGFLFAAAAAAV